MDKTVFVMTSTDDQDVARLDLVIHKKLVEGEGRLERHEPGGEEREAQRGCQDHRTPGSGMLKKMSAPTESAR